RRCRLGRAAADAGSVHVRLQPRAGERGGLDGTALRPGGRVRPGGAGAGAATDGPGTARTAGGLHLAGAVPDASAHSPARVGLALLLDNGAAVARAADAGVAGGAPGGRER